jgi:hypothetical protein
MVIERELAVIAVIPPQPAQQRRDLGTPVIARDRKSVFPYELLVAREDL